MMLSPMKNNGEDIESYESIKTEHVEFCKKRQRTLSPMKNKGKDIESYGNIKARMLRVL